MSSEGFSRGTLSNVSNVALLSKCTKDVNATRSSSRGNFWGLLLHRKTRRIYSCNSLQSLVIIMELTRNIISTCCRQCSCAGTGSGWESSCSKRTYSGPWQSQWARIGSDSKPFDSRIMHRRLQLRCRKTTSTWWWRNNGYCGNWNNTGLYGIVAHPPLYEVNSHLYCVYESMDRCCPEKVYQKQLHPSAGSDIHAQAAAPCYGNSSGGTRRPCCIDCAQGLGISWPSEAAFNQWLHLVQPDVNFNSHFSCTALLDGPLLFSLLVWLVAALQLATDYRRKYFDPS